MKKKIIIFSMLLISVLFIGMGKVSAEEYQVGDLVEVINPSGGKSMEFYVLSNNVSGIHLLSKEKYWENKSLQSGLLGDIENEITNEDFKYLFDFENTIEDENGYTLSFIQDVAIPTFACDIDFDKYENFSFSQIEYFNCPSVYEQYVGSYSYFFSNDYEIGIFEKSDNPNYQYMLTGYSEDDSSILNKKIDFYLNIAIDKENFDILKKVELPSKEENNDVPTTTITKNDSITNPKTADINIMLIVGLSSLVLIGSIVSVKKLKKLSK